MRLTPAPTRGDGNCAFHAVFGTWNGQEYVYADIKARRKEVADQIRTITIASQNLFPSVSEAIKELIRGNNQQIQLNAIQFPLITQRQLQYQKENEGFEDLALFDPMLNGNIVCEYASFIEMPGMWLLPCELNLLAHASNKTVRYFIDDKQTKEGYRLIDTYHPDSPTIVNIYFNGKNHYQVMQVQPETLAHLASQSLPTLQHTLSMEESHKASGSKKSLHGIIYQLKLLILFLYRGYTQQYQSCLTTERDDAEKFDDLVFKYKPVGSNNYRYRFLQAKHKQDDNEVISEIDLWNINDGEFSLIKYFAAFQKIKSNPAFNDGVLEEFCICTNIGFALDPLREGQSILHLSSALEKVTTPDLLLDTQLSKANKYRFKKSLFPGKAALYQHFKQNSPHIKLAQELKKQIKLKNKVDLRNPLVKEHHGWLIQNGIIHVKTHKLTNNFLNNTDLTPVALQFHAYYHGTQTEDLSVTDAHIEEFLDHLVFAVNQPDEVSLEGILVKELATEFNLKENSELLYAELQNVTLAWMKDKRGTFLTHDKTKTLFDELRQKLSRLALIGSTLDYQKKLQQSGYTFTPATPVQDFLKGPKQAMMYHTPGDVFLGSMQVYQTLQSLDRYQADNSYIFITLKKALRLKDLVTQSFIQSKLLVIACNIPIENTARALINNLLNPLPQQAKIIFITSQTRELQHLIDPSNRKTHIANGGFSDLEKSSQLNLQKRLIHFQVVTTTLGQLVPNLDSIIDSSVLLDLIGTQENTVGAPLIVDELAYFVERKFKRYNAVPPQSIEENKNDIFAIISRQKEQLITLLDHDIPIHSFSDTQENQESSYRIVLLDPNDAQSQFQALCTQYPDRSLHYVIHQNDHLVWQNSHGSRDNLELKSLRNLNELQDGCCIISAEPGMGKTTILSYFIHQLKQKNPLLWIFSINLLAVESQLKIVEFTNKESIISFFMQNATPLERKIFEYRLQHGGIAFFLDGFDEIQAAQQIKVIRLLTLLKATRAEKIVITTRRHMQNKLEESLFTPAYRLQSFNERDIYLFFKQFWQNLLKLESIDVKKVELYVEGLLNIFRTSVKEDQREFIGIPLQTQLLATAFAADFQRFYEGGNAEPHFPETIPLFGLYERFVKIKYEIALKDKLKLIDTIQQSTIGPILIDKLEKYHQYLAMHILFPELNQFSLPLQENHINLVNLAGMIQLINGEARAVHRTFLELFAARFLIKQLQKPSYQLEHQTYKSLLINHIFKARYEVIHSFMEEIIEQLAQLPLQQVWKTILDCNLLPIPITHRESEEDSSTGSISSDELSEQSMSDYSTSNDSVAEEEGSDSEMNGKLYIYDSGSPSDVESLEESMLSEENSTENTVVMKPSFENAERLLSEKYAKVRFLKKDIPDIKKYTTRIYTYLIATNDIPSLEKTINNFKNILKQTSFPKVSAHIISLFIPLLNHYIKICHHAGILFNNHLIQELKDISTLENKKDYEKLLEKLPIFNELYTYNQCAQKITPSFLTSLTASKILYLWQLADLEVTPELMESLVNAYRQRVRLQEHIYKQLLLKLASIHPPFVPQLRALIITQGDVDLLALLQSTLPNSDISLQPFEVLEIVHKKKVTWLETQGFPLLRQYSILTPKIIQEFQGVFNGKIAHKHAKKIWRHLITKLLNQPYANIINSHIDTTALLSFSLEVMKHLSIKENKSSIAISRLGMTNLLQLIAAALIQLAPTQAILSSCVSLLVCLNKTGLLLIDKGSTLLILDPRSEFEYELHYNPHIPLAQLIVDNVNQSAERFEQQCQEEIISMQGQWFDITPRQHPAVFDLPQRNTQNKRLFNQISSLNEHSSPADEMEIDPRAVKKIKHQEI